MSAESRFDLRCRLDQVIDNWIDEWPDSTHDELIHTLEDTAFDRACLVDELDEAEEEYSEDDDAS